MKLEGIIKSDGFVETSGGYLSYVDEKGFVQVLIDATSVGGSGSFKRQSIEPFIGMKVEFVTNNGLYGFNFTLK